MLHRATEFASLLFRSSASNNVQRGYELAFDVRQQKILLRRHGPNVVTLAEAIAPIHVATLRTVKIAAREGEIRVWLDNDPNPLIVTHDPDPIIQPGQVGIRTWGSAVSVDKLTLSAGTEMFDVLASTATREVKVPAERALESLCLMLLNLNEFVYVD
jgi:hypothetical protein